VENIADDERNFDREHCSAADSQDSRWKG
jgi:hypothetical protein